MEGDVVTLAEVATVAALLAVFVGIAAAMLVCTRPCRSCRRQRSRDRVGTR